MLSDIGNLLQIIAISSALSCVLLGDLRLFLLSAFSVISAFGLLLFAFISSDFSIQNVVIHSSTIKPMLFKISGAWASHEGSLLLWLTLFTSVSCLGLHYDKKIVRTLAAIEAMMVALLYFSSNPFASLSFKPEQGLGLNPMLQDHALAIHPPALYLGYVMSVLPFALALEAMMRNSLDSVRVELIRKFTSLSLLFMTIGVGLGSWWAYRELGWGGFWFFDPVENVSIMPWISAIMAYHSVIFTAKSGKLAQSTLTFSVLTFLLAILGTFFVRSGVLTSVYSFAYAPEKGILILSIFAILAIPSLGLLCYRGAKSSPMPLSFKEKGVIAGNYFWALSLAILVFATCYPIFYQIFYEQSVTIDPSFFVKVWVPLLLPIFMLCGIFSFKDLNRDHITGFLLTTIMALVLSVYVKMALLSFAFCWGSIFVIVQSILWLLKKTRYFKIALSVKGSAMMLGHIGLGILALSITLNSLLQEEIHFVGKVGSILEEANLKVELKGLRFSEGPNYYRQIAEFWLYHKDGTITILKPENRLYTIEKSLSQESDIYSYLTADYYAVLSRIDEQIVSAKIYTRPMISFLWLAIVIMASSFFLRESLNKEQKSK